MLLSFLLLLVFDDPSAPTMTGNYYEERGIVGYVRQYKRIAEAQTEEEENRLIDSFLIIAWVLNPYCAFYVLVWSLWLSVRKYVQIRLLIWS